MQDAAEQAKKSEHEMQKQFTKLHQDHEALRKNSMMQLQEKVCSGINWCDVEESI